MAIPKEHVDTVCRIGQGSETCRYLSLGQDGFGCLKNTSLQGHVDARALVGAIAAQGDNCDGWNEPTALDSPDDE